MKVKQEFVYLGRKLKRLPCGKWRMLSTGQEFRTKQLAMDAVAAIIFPYRYTGIPIKETR
jgi:hypothetical protein